MRKIKILSLFDGMSCGQIALKKLGLTEDMYEYYASEIKPFGIKVTQHNFPSTKQLGDITKVYYREGVLYSENGDFEVGGIDLLIGGSPCQDFSILNKNVTGLRGKKSSLFYEYLRILEEVSPKYFLLENVASMKDSDKEVLNEYMGVRSIFVDSRVVSAQIRKRYYWTNTLKNLNIEDKEIMFNSVLDSGYSHRVKGVCLLESNSRPNTTPYRMFSRHIKSFANFVFKDKEHYQECLDFYNTYFKGLSAKDKDKLVEQGLDVSVFDGIRILSRRESERLQTVPEGYTDCVSELEAFSLLGDGWTVDVIVEFFKPFIKEMLSRN